MKYWLIYLLPIMALCSCTSTHELILNDNVDNLLKVMQIKPTSIDTLDRNGRTYYVVKYRE